MPGIGVKTAAELINTYGDLETLLACVDAIKQPKRRQALIENESQGAAVEGVGQARRRRAAALPAIGPEGKALRPRSAVSVSR